MRPAELLDEDGFARVEAAIRGAESRTRGEIVFAVVERSDAYLGPRALLAAGAAFAAGVIALALGGAPALGFWLPPLEAAVFALALLAAQRPAALRALLRPAGCRAGAERGARLAFLGEGVSATRERTGILVYLSLLERQVVVLADLGIAQRVPDTAWQQVVERILRGIREGAAERGLEEGVALCGELLAAHFPAEGPNPNELPDAIRRQ